MAARLTRACAAALLTGQDARARLEHGPVVHQNAPDVRRPRAQGRRRFALPRRALPDLPLLACAHPQQLTRAAPSLPVVQPATRSTSSLTRCSCWPRARSSTTAGARPPRPTLRSSASRRSVRRHPSLLLTPDCSSPLTRSPIPHAEGANIADFMTGTTSAQERRVRDGFEHKAPTTVADFARRYRESDTCRAMRAEMDAHLGRMADVERETHDAQRALQDEKHKGAIRREPHVRGLWAQTMIALRRERQQRWGDQWCVHLSPFSRHALPPRRSCGTRTDREASLSAARSGHSGPAKGRRSSRPLSSAPSSTTCRLRRATSCVHSSHSSRPSFPARAEPLAHITPTVPARRHDLPLAPVPVAHLAVRDDGRVRGPRRPGQAQGVRLSQAVLAPPTASGR